MTAPRFTKARVIGLGAGLLAFGLVWNSLAALLIWAGYATPVEVALLLLPFQYLPSLGIAIIAAAMVLM